MALFKKNSADKKEKEVAKKADKKASNTATKASTKTATIQKDLSSVILKPRITEKAAVYADGSNAYSFDVSPRSNKTEIAQAIEAIYKVKPIKVNIIKIPRKTVRVRGTMGVKGGGKKAVVFLKKGDQIEFV